MAFLIMPQTKVYADTKMAMHIKVTADDFGDFKGTLVVSFINESEKKTNVSLNLGNNYSSQEIVLKQGLYKVTATFRDCEGEWIAEGLDSEYDFKPDGNNPNVEIKINIRPFGTHGEEMVTEAGGKENETETANINDIVQGVSFEEAETVLQTFIDKTYSIVTSESFSMFLSIMTNDNYFVYRKYCNFNSGLHTQKEKCG